MRVRLNEADRKRIGDVFAQHRGFVEAVAVQEVGHDEAPDVVAEVGLRLCQSMNGLRDPGAIRTWIYRVTVSVARDTHADRARFERTRDRLAAFTNPHEAVVDPDEHLRNARRHEAFTDALNRLKSHDKTLICHSLGLGTVYVAHDATDRRALSRARQRLRAYLIRDPRVT